MDIENNSNITISINDVKDGQIAIGTNAKVNLIGELDNDRKIEIIVGENSELKSYIIQKNGSLE